jgi:hypothetical protein
VREPLPQTALWHKAERAGRPAVGTLSPSAASNAGEGVLGVGCGGGHFQQAVMPGCGGVRVQRTGLRWRPATGSWATTPSRTSWSRASKTACLSATCGTTRSVAPPGSGPFVQPSLGEGSRRARAALPEPPPCEADERQQRAEQAHTPRAGAGATTGASRSPGPPGSTMRPSSPVPSPATLSASVNAATPPPSRSRDRRCPSPSISGGA